MPFKDPDKRKKASRDAMKRLRDKRGLEKLNFDELGNALAPFLPLAVARGNTEQELTGVNTNEKNETPPAESDTEGDRTVTITTRKYGKSFFSPHSKDQQTRKRG